MFSMKSGNGHLHLSLLYALLGLCVALSPACEKKGPSGPAIAVPTFTRTFTAAGKDYHYGLEAGSPQSRHRAKESDWAGSMRPRPHRGN